MLEEAIFEEIKKDSVIANKISSGNGIFRIYPLRVPNGVPPSPCLVYTEISQSLIYPVLRSSLFQISCIAPKFEEARGLAIDIDRIFNDYKEGFLGDKFAVKYIKFQGRFSLYDEEAGLYVFPVEVSIKY